jgi:hypothetical protein
VAVDQLAIPDLTGTDLIECMYGYTEMEALATYFDMDSRVSAHLVAIRLKGARYLYINVAVEKRNISGV